MIREREGVRGAGKRGLGGTSGAGLEVSVEIL